MSKNCMTKRYSCPAGIWGYENLIGAKVAIKSTTIGNFNPIAVEDEYKIKDIYFRISTDGKTITLVELEGLPDEYFTFKDLEVIRVVANPGTNNKPGEELTVGINTVL